MKRSDLAGPGISRRRCGRGFRYFWPSSAPVRDSAEVARIKGLVIPPAWEQVWICPEPDGHIQAVGTDAAGRRQYLYHEQWRQEQDQHKFDRMLEFGRALPRIRETVLDRLSSRGLHRDRVLAAAIRLVPVVRSSSRPRGGRRISRNGLACTSCLDPGVALAALAIPRNIHRD